MSRHLIIRIPPGGPGIDPDMVSWLLQDDSGDGGEVSHGSLDEVAPLAPGTRVSVLVPSMNFILASASVPTQNRQRLQKALPFLLEDQLVDDVELLHFALGEKRTDGTVYCAVVQATMVEDWLERLRRFNINPHAMIPDVLALPMAPGRWWIVREEEHYLIRTGKESGYYCERDNVLTVLEALLMEGDAPEAITLVDLDPEAGTLEDFSSVEDLPALELETPGGDPLQWYRGQVSDKPSLNILQGGFSRREQMGRLWRPWLPAAALFVAYIVIQLLVSGIHYFQVSGEVASLEQEAAEAYYAAYPDAKKEPVDRLWIKMRSKLQALKGGDANAAGGSGFLDILGKAGPVFRKTTGLVIKTLRYRGGKLEVSVDITDIQGLDKLKQALTDSGIVSVEILSANARGDKVEGRLQLGGGGS